MKPIRIRADAGYLGNQQGHIVAFIDSVNGVHAVVVWDNGTISEVLLSAVVAIEPVAA